MKKIIFLSFISGIFAFVIFIFYLTWDLYQMIEGSLEKGWFSPPIQYYTAPEKISISSPFPLEFFKKKLRKRYYSPVELENHFKTLAPGFFIEQKKQKCLDLNNNIPVDECLSWRAFGTKEQYHLSFKDKKLFLLIKNNKVVDSITLPPFLFAQYENGEPVLTKKMSLSDFPFYCLQSVLSAEDHQFVLHKGLSFKSIFRAFLRNLQAGRLKEGGSTITQQLVKNIFFSSKKSFKRKIKEQITAVLLEFKLNKDQILTAYLNKVYMGQNGVFRLHGFATAAEYYFEKPLSSLNLNECALLASLIKSPGSYVLDSHKTSLLKRRNYILDLLFKRQIIDKSKWQLAKSQPVSLSRGSGFSPPAYFIDGVYKELIQKYIPLKGGLKVFTTLRLEFQQVALQSVRKGLELLESKKKPPKKKFSKSPPLQVALISLDVMNGAVRALVGGRDFKASQFNRAVQAQRQVGSLMKPVVVLSALIKNPDLNPLSLVEDAPLKYKYGSIYWRPKNYKKDYKGFIPLYQSLAFSLNTAIARLGLQTGLPALIQTMEKLGNFELQTNSVHPSLILGALEMSPWEVAQLYLNIANMAYPKKIHLIEKATDLKGNELYTFQRKETKAPLLSPQKTAVLVGMLQEITQSGTAKSLKDFPISVAGKTGTTNKEKDAWFVGFTPEILTVVWLGFDNSISHGFTGAGGALPIWHFFMRNIVPFLSLKKDFDWPEGVEKSSFIPAEKTLKSNKENLDSVSFPESVQLIFEK